MRTILLIASTTLVCQSADLMLPGSAFERDRAVSFTYRTNPQATGKGQLAIKWTDVHGRVVEDRTIPVELTDETEIPFQLDLRRAVGMRNKVEAHLTITGVDKSGKPDRRDESATATFITKPRDRRWQDYNIIMWQQHPAAVFSKLKPMGITGGQYSGRATTPPEHLLSNDLRWYAENIATDFYAEYHRFRRDRRPNWSFYEAKDLYKKDPNSKEAFKRHPSLSDPSWLRKVHDRLVESAKHHSQFRPFFYSLGDESGIADLSAYWDFDFSDYSLAEMRLWLKERYGTLAALNRQWGSNFTAWERVVPDTTREAMQRTDENYSSWSDHKEWMDVAFARALKMGADAINSVDPDAFVNIGGAQMPGWGGYDYYKLTQSLSALEPYDIGNNVEIIRSLNPRTVMMTTAFAKGPWEKHRVWYELLHGHRGLILWDDKSEYISRTDGSLGERGKEAPAYYNEIRSGVGALLINSVRESDPIAIHYSQSSMRSEWMREQKPKGDAWLERNASTERKDSEFMRVRESWCRLIEDLGLQYNFVAYGQIEEGELIRRGYRVLVLPRSSSLSPEEVAAIEAFSAQGGVVIADGEPGVFDEHVRRLEQPALAGLKSMLRVREDMLNYHQQRLVHKEGATHAAMRSVFTKAGVTPAFRMMDASGKPPVGLELHRFRNGAVTVLGLHANPQLRVDELGPPEFKSNERFEKPQRITLTLPAEMYVTDVRAAKSLGRVSKLELTVDSYEPRMLAVSAVPLRDFRVVAPVEGKRGETLSFGIRVESPAEKHVFRVECVGPDGSVLPHYSGNIVSENGSAMTTVPLALNDAPGQWTVRITDVLSGATKALPVTVR